MVMAERPNQPPSTLRPTPRLVVDHVAVSAHRCRTSREFAQLVDDVAVAIMRNPFFPVSESFWDFR